VAGRTKNSAAVSVAQRFKAHTLTCAASGSGTVNLAVVVHRNMRQSHVQVATNSPNSIRITYRMLAAEFVAPIVH